MRANTNHAPIHQTHAGAPSFALVKGGEWPIIKMAKPNRSPVVGPWPLAEGLSVHGPCAPARLRLEDKRRAKCCRPRSHGLGKQLGRPQKTPFFTNTEFFGTNSRPHALHLKRH